MGRSDTIACSMNYALLLVQNELESSGFDRVVFDIYSNNFYCIGEGQPDSFEDFKMISSSNLLETLPLWTKYADR